jgi:hypothetical protein
MALDDVHLLLYMPSLLDSIEMKYSKLINILLFVLRVDHESKSDHGIKRSLHKNKKVDIIEPMSTFLLTDAFGVAKHCKKTHFPSSRLRYILNYTSPAPYCEYPPNQAHR